MGILNSSMSENMEMSCSYLVPNIKGCIIYAFLNKPIGIFYSFMMQYFNINNSLKYFMPLIYLLNFYV